jgi:UDP-2-acetamido-3-amino-2,3-dideoxy-glucuronate N-acetyltransferase
MLVQPEAPRKHSSKLGVLNDAAMSERAYFVHETACVDEPVTIGERTRIWHFSHVMSGALIGSDCVLGQNVMIASGARLGRGVRIQNNVSVYDGVELADYVFCGPSCVFTNVVNPRAEISRKHEVAPTKVSRGATIGANATIVCGTTIGRYAFVAAGAVVARGVVPDYAMVAGVPGERIGWMSRHGHRLGEPDSSGIRTCPGSGWRYREVAPDVLRCLDRDEDAPLEAT